MHAVYYPIAGDTLPIPFDSFDGGTGASITITGLAVTDIEIYQDTSMVQRASDNGYALIDTDGIDLDGAVGIHGFSIDLNDNSDAGFYTVGPWYRVVVNAITVDGQTVRFTAAVFRILNANRGMAGNALPDAAADAAGGVPISDAGGLDLDGMNTSIGNIETDTSTTLDNLVDDLETRLGTPGNLGGGATIANNLSDMAGATFATATDSQEAIRNHIGDGSNLTEAGGDGDHLTTLAQASVCTEARLAELAAANIPADIDTLLSRVTAAVATASVLAAVNTIVTNLNLGIIYGAAAAGTLSVTQSTTNLTGYADDQLIGRYITWTSGDAEGEQRVITDSANTGGLLTFAALTTAPAADDTFKIT